MWNFLNRPNVKSSESLVEHGAGSRVKRRRTRLVAGVESLETRAMLSASGIDSSADLIAAKVVADRLPPIAAEVSLIESAGSKLGFGSVGRESDVSVQIDEPQFSFGLADAMIAAIATNGSSQRASIVNGNGAAFGSLGDTFTGLTGRPVELRVAQTGQVVVLRSATSVQDDSGLTVSDDSAPTTYLRATDAEGRAFSQLVFVTQAARFVPGPESQSPTDLNGAVVAEAEHLTETNSEELAARPELHEFVTALDEPNATASPTDKTDDMQPSLTAVTRTRWMSSSRVSVSVERSESVSHAAAKVAQFTSNERTDDGSDKDSTELPTMPVIDPTTRSMVLSVCLLGTLARVTARRRRRQKAALLAQGFTVH